MTIKEEIKKMKAASWEMSASTHEMRCEALKKIKETLQNNSARIYEANAADLKRAEDEKVSDSVKKRLKFDDGKMSDVCAGIDRLVSLEDPIGKVDLIRELDSDLLLKRISVPIGVIGVIFEARPDALVQIASLCIKSGNCAVLKGGSETRDTNAVLFSLIHQAVISAGLPDKSLIQADTHSQIDELLSCDGLVDLIIPRGSNAFVSYIMEHTRIPVMGHADGICHTYVDGAADAAKVIPLVLDAKLQYTAACNATETLLIDHKYPMEEVKKLFDKLRESHIVIRGDEAAKAVYSMEELTDKGYDKEYLEPVLSVRFVDGVKEAVEHINNHGSHHTDCIITEDEAAADYFMKFVDSAGVYQNASTRFADGFRYGFGAEVGISTGKLHARGPVGIFGLCTYKYTLRGNGSIVADYSNGKKEFHFKDIIS